MNKETIWNIVTRLAWIWIICSISAGIGVRIVNKDYTEQIKQLKQSNIEITQECEVYKNRSAEYENRCLELENIIEGTGLVVDNCECR